MSAHNSFLLLFGILLVAAAIYFGMRTVNSYSASADRDQLISSLYDCGLTAQKVYEESGNKSGSGKSFEKWTLPKNYESTEYGYLRAGVKNKRVDIVGVGNQTGRNGFTNVRVAARIDSSGIRVTIIN